MHSGRNRIRCIRIYESKKLNLLFRVYQFSTKPRALFSDCSFLSLAFKTAELSRLEKIEELSQPGNRPLPKTMSGFQENVRNFSPASEPNINFSKAAAAAAATTKYSEPHKPTKNLSRQIEQEHISNY